MNEIGLVIVNIPELHSRRMLKQIAQRAIDRVPPGRTLAFVFRMSPSWKISSPVEGVLTDVVLGGAIHRSIESSWEFAGNLAVRVCKPAPLTRQVTHEIGVLFFRRIGDKPYIRRRSVTREVEQAATMASLHPVFTRDVANNIWHLKSGNSLTRVRQRLGALLAWPDESILVLTERTSRIYKNVPLNLDNDLIGVPTKTTYSWL